MGPIGVLGLFLWLQLCEGSAELRLVGGGGRCAGRVEVNHNGEWGSVCVFEFDWEARWATVVCRQLGCGRVASASSYTPFGQGTGRIWLEPYFCLGTEEVLEECPHLGWGQHFCSHERDVGVICTEAVELRLVDGGGPCAGRVEVKLRGQWGSVGDDIWDMEDAEVVCQQLGCGSAAGTYNAHERFGIGTGPINLVLVDCKGDEAALWDCEIRGWGPYKGIHDFDSTVVCQGFSRLVGGDRACAGQLEVWQRRAWVGVCAEHVDMKVAQVVCRELGCGAALAIPGSGRFGEGTGPLWEGGFNCTGTESLLSACAQQVPHGQNCTGHATIICSPYTGFRLENGSSACAGRVEVAVRGTWGSICATAWDLPDANVLCHHLGCGHATTVPPGGSFGSGDGPLRPDAFGCSGNEKHPGECPVAVLGEPPCTPGNAAAVSCSGMEGAVESLRLVEGESRCDGYLEEAITTPAWRRVPAEQWETWDVYMVCAVLGCGLPENIYTALGIAPTALTSSYTEVDVTTEEMYDISWMGSGLTMSPEEVENGLEGTTSVSEMRPAPAKSPEEMAIICSGSRRVRLVGSPTHCAGRVEVYASGTWSTICQESWDLQDAAVVCRELGCGTALEAPGLARFGPGTGTLWPYITDCNGTEKSLWECPRSERRECKRGAAAGAICSEQLSLRLAGGRGRCSGYLEVLHNSTWGRVCANGTSPATAAAVCRQLGCGDRGQLAPVPTQHPAPAWLAWVGCEEGAHSLWGCPSAPWHLQTCGPGGDAHVACVEDSDGTSETPTTPCPDGAICTGIPSSTTLGVAKGTVPVPTRQVAKGTVPVPVVLCVVLGTLLCLALGALAVLACRARAWRRGPGRAGGAISDAIYEELDYIAMPEYQEVPSPPGSLWMGSVKKLPYYTTDSVEGSSTDAAPGPSALLAGTPDGCDDAADVLEESPTPSTGNIFKGVAERGWICVLPTGGSCPSPSPPEATRDTPGQPHEHSDYDDVGTSTLNTLQ